MVFPKAVNAAGAGAHLFRRTVLIALLFLTAWASSRMRWLQSQPRRNLRSSFCSVVSRSNSV